MKRIRGYQVFRLPLDSWPVTMKKSQWKLPQIAIPRGLTVYESWHRCWDHARDVFLDDYEHHVNGATPSEVVIVACKLRVVLAVISEKTLVNELVDTAGRVGWVAKPLIASRTDEDKLHDSQESVPMVYFNHHRIAWVAMTGARYEVPCSLGLLERRARKNPDGFCGRLLARYNEFRDYFRPG